MSDDRYIYNATIKPIYMTVDECSKKRETCHKDVCNNIDGINDKLAKVTERFEEALEVATNEMIELRKSMSDIVLKIAILLVGFAATIVSALIAVIVLLV